MKSALAVGAFLLLTESFPAMAENAEVSSCARAPDGTVWSVHARRFIFAPVIAFTNVDGAVRYEMEIVDDFHRLQYQTSPAPELDLSTHWKALPVGYVTVSCRAFDANGGLRGRCRDRTG